MNSPASFLMKLTQGALGAKVMALAAVTCIGAMTLPSLAHFENSSWNRLRQSDFKIKEAEEFGSDMERRLVIVKQRNSIRMDLLREVAKGKVTKQAAAQRYLEMNKTEPAILVTLRKSYSCSDDLECAMKQLDLHLQGYYEDLEREQISRSAPSSNP